MKLSIALSLLLISGAVSAQSLPPPPPPPPQTASSATSDQPADASPHLISHPPYEVLSQALVASDLSQARVALLIDHSAKGVPKRVRLTEPTGSDMLDQAILAWGRAVRITPGEAGTVRLPFDLLSETPPLTIAADEARARYPEIEYAGLVSPPPLTPILQASAKAGLPRADAELLLAYDEAGRIARIAVLDSSGNAAVDAAIRVWAAQLHVKTEAEGAGRLKFSFTAR